MASMNAAQLLGPAARRAVRTRVDAVGDGAEQLAQDLAVERGLAAEVVVEHRLVDARRGGDAVDLGAVEPAGGELAARPRRAAAPRVGLGAGAVD